MKVTAEKSPFQDEFNPDSVYTGERIRETILKHHKPSGQDIPGLVNICRGDRQPLNISLTPQNLDQLIPDQAQSRVIFEEISGKMYRTQFAEVPRGYRCIEKTFLG